MEREIILLAERDDLCADYFAYVKAQAAVASRSAFADAPVQWDPFVDDLARLLRVPRAYVVDSDADVGRVMMAATPLVRSQLMFSSLAKGQAPGTPVGLPPSLVPLALLGLWTVARLAREAGMSGISFQTVMRLYNDFRPTLFLIGHLNSVVAWRDAAEIDIAAPIDGTDHKRFVRLARALLPRRQRRIRQSLGDILFNEMPRGDGVEAADFVRLVASRLHGRINVLGSNVRPRFHLHNIRRSVVRWALSAASDDVVVLASRLSGQRKH